MKALTPPVDLVFYIGNRSGCRLGEILGLRLGDLGFLEEGLIRVAHSFDGPLKEDRRGTGKVKWAPAAMDALTVLGPHLAARRAAGGTDDDLVFVPILVADRPRKTTWRGLKKEYVRDRWDDARRVTKVEMTFYEATRHSFISRSLSAGVPLEEVSSAVGHSTTEMTKRYDRFIRKTFSPAIRGAGAPAGSGGSSGRGRAE
jgi:integrase